MELTGKITTVLPLVTGEGKNGTWKKQEYVLEFASGQYPKRLCFSIWGDKIDQMPVTLNSEVKVHFDLESKEYNGRYFTEARAWRIDSIQAGAPQAPQSTGGAPQNTTEWPAFNPTAATTNAVADDDLPF
jgi:hypothetical protein